jgi:hypothetical protein
MIEFDYKETFHTSIPIGENVKKLIQYINILKITKFINEMRETAPAKVHEVIERQMRYNLRRNYSMPEFIEGLYKVKEQMNSVQMDTKTKDAFLTWLEKKDKELMNEKQQVEAKAEIKDSNKLQAPEIRIFFSLVHQSKILLKNEDESAENYITRASNFLNIEITNTNARKYFIPNAPIKAEDKKLQKVIDKILPIINEDISKKIIDYIETEIKTKKSTKMSGLKSGQG